MNSQEYVIGLGSNLGDRLTLIRTAVKDLAQLGQLVRASPIYESEPLGPPQPSYLNAAVLLRSELGPMELLSGLHSLERAAGRERRIRWGPRTLDLDILWARGLRVSEPELCVPHPELSRRAFAIMPLLDVVPDAVDPMTGTVYSDQLRSLDVRTLRRFAEPPPIIRGLC